MIFHANVYTCILYDQFPRLSMINFYANVYYLRPKFKLVELSSQLVIHHFGTLSVSESNKSITLRYATCIFILK